MSAVNSASFLKSLKFEESVLVLPIIAKIFFFYFIFSVSQFTVLMSESALRLQATSVYIHLYFLYFIASIFHIPASFLRVSKCLTRLYPKLYKVF